MISVPEEVSDLILEFAQLDHPSYYTELLHSCSHISRNFYYSTRRRLFRFIRYDPSSYDLLLVIFSKNTKLSSFVQTLALDAKHTPDIPKLYHLTGVKTLLLYSEGPQPGTISAEVLDRPVPMTHVRDVLLFNVTLDINGFCKLLRLCPGWTELGTENAVITDVPGRIDDNDRVRQYHFKCIPTRPRQSLSRRSSMESDAKVGRAVDLDRLLRMPFVFSCTWGQVAVELSRRGDLCALQECLLRRHECVRLLKVFLVPEWCSSSQQPIVSNDGGESTSQLLQIPTSVQSIVIEIVVQDSTSYIPVLTWWTDSMKGSSILPRLQTLQFNLIIDEDPGNTHTGDFWATFDHDIAQLSSATVVFWILSIDHTPYATIPSNLLSPYIRQGPQKWKDLIETQCSDLMKAQRLGVHKAIKYTRLSPFKEYVPYKIAWI